MPRKVNSKLGLIFLREWCDPTGLLLAKIYSDVDRNEYCIRYDAIADFHVAHDGSRVRVTSARTTRAHDIEHIEFNQIAPLALSLQGHLVLHSSAIALTANTCVGFVGPSGRGKSTLAASFATRGMPFLSDDGLAVDPVGGGYVAHSRHDFVRLREDSKQFLVNTTDGLVETGPSGPKWKATASAPMLHHSGSLPLLWLYFLGAGEAHDVQIKRMSQREAAQALLSSTFVLDTTDRRVMTRHFAQINALVAITPCFALDYPRQYAFIPTVHEAIIGHAADVDSAHAASPVNALPHSAENLSTVG